jgi:uncharacterized protein (TIGR02391 family)
MNSMTIDIFLKVQRAHTAIQKLPGMLNGPISAELGFDDCVHDLGLRKVARKLFNDGHYAKAVEEGYKYFNNLVKRKTASAEDGAKLMEKVFSPGNPIIRLNQGQSESDTNEQLGYMRICAGCMTGIRNPRAHENDPMDSRHSALQLLMFADHLVGKVQDAKCRRTRNRTSLKS